jgi:heme-degrading monooxygenase HmoA
MYVIISIHHPRKEHEAALLDSMHRYGAAARSQKGLRAVHTLRDKRKGVLVGLAIWESEAARRAADAALTAATEGDDFDTWESKPITGYVLEEA